MFARRKPSGRGRALALVALALPLALLAPSALSACGGDDDDDDDNSAAAGRPGGEAQTPPVVEERVVIYLGGTTDETLHAVTGVALVVDDARAARLSSPGAGETMSAATPPTFGWSAPRALAPAPASPSFWARARGALAERSAYAHGTPYNGVAYLLSIASAAGTPLLTVLTAETSFTPDATEWAAVVAAGGEVRVHLVTARCDQNAVVGGGPWAPAAGPVALRIDP